MHGNYYYNTGEYFISLNGNRCFRWKRYNLRVQPDVTATLNRYSSVTTAMLYSTDLTKDTPSSKIMRVCSPIVTKIERIRAEVIPDLARLDDRRAVGAEKRGR